MKELTCFKAYDIRGKLGESLNEDVAYRIGRAYAQHLNAKMVVVGGDIRLSSGALKNALSKGLNDGGADVIDIGMSGTEEVYFATPFFNACGGIEVTASHNPIDYNGMKLVAKDSKPISGDTGLNDIKRLAENNQFATVEKRGSITQQSIKADFTEFLLQFVDRKALTPKKIILNPGNGAAGPLLDVIEGALTRINAPIEFIKVNYQPDGEFPNGIPNPLLPENRAATSEAVLENNADFGIAWDGDFDRCFLFDEKGQFIEGYYIVGLLAEAFLNSNPGSKIIHDPRLTWNTIDVVTANGGRPVQSKTGHAFIKERMRLEDAIYGGEMSAHHYFRDFYYCDSGMIPWILTLNLLCHSKATLSDLIENRVKTFPSSGEINLTIEDSAEKIELIAAHFGKDGFNIDRTDGISIDLNTWRFNVRTSNTEPLVRLNVESRGDIQLMKEKTKILIEMITGP
ncbi:phosphomannomutase CpsG [Vibrio sp. 404]|uniref:phosphomannomutase n=1 Tax=Vibrio marinisediminis TaxID=2758441 RepID=A0A7W2IV88_9VIBR|nr:phosphomannomutase CpsG [Vibrio marinisediminis]MBA5764361.1 phosphomannomutase CpsG [Vibrio marinisediminis]